MKTKGLAFVILILLSLSSYAQESKNRFGFELSTGASVATKKLGGSTVNPGLGFEAIFHYRVLAHAGIFVGWGWNKFGVDESFVGNDRDFEETGYVFGVEFKHPIGESKTSYYLRAGGLYNHIEIEKGGDVTHNSGHGLGWQLAGGLDFPLGKNWSLTPGVKFNSLSRDVENQGVNVPLDLNYLQFRIGILKKF